MKLSTKGRYGVKAMVDLAIHYGDAPVSIKTISNRQSISEYYLEQLFSPLRKAKLITSIRGAQGGYVLAKEPKEIKISEIMNILEGPVEVADCIDKASCDNIDCCATRLRCTVYKAELVNDSLLKNTGASGVVHKGNGVQIIYGPRVTVIKSNFEDYLETAPNIEYNKKDNAVKNEDKEDDIFNEDKDKKKIVKSIVISSPITGISANLDTAADEAFASRMMGDGAIVTPTDEIVVAPDDGEIIFVFDTKHAVGFTTKDGISMIIHIGIDTVKLGGQGFSVLVKAGDKMKKGDTIMKLDLEYLKQNAPSVASPVICTELADNQKIRLVAEGKINAGEELFAIDFYE